MTDLIVENLGKIILGILVLLIGSLIWYVWFFSTHCLSTHKEMRYHAPIYQKVGSAMMPIGGGYYNDTVCDKWR